MVLVCAPTRPALCPGMEIGIVLPQVDIFPCRARGIAVLVVPLHITGYMVLLRSVELGFPGLHKLFSLSSGAVVWAGTEPATLAP